MPVGLACVNVTLHLGLGGFALYTLGSLSSAMSMHAMPVTELVGFLVMCLLSMGLFVKSPMVMVLTILAGFMQASFLMFMPSAELLTLLSLIVYLGALMILFIFIMMLLDLDDTALNVKSYTLPLSLTFMMITNVGGVDVPLSPSSLSSFEIMHNATQVAPNSMRSIESLYTTDNILFLYVTVILLFTLLGAVMMACNTSTRS